MKRLHQYSQHFLRNPRFVHELIGHASIRRDDVVYDIGAGSGVITSALASRCKQVIAVEPEPGTARLLRKNTEKFSNITVIEKDFLTLPLPKKPYKVFANIPFHLSSAIVHKLTEDRNPPVAAYLIVQKQLANKLLPAHSGFTSQLGMILGPRFAIRVRKRLKRTDFWPHPNVDTVLLEIKHREHPLTGEHEHATYVAFIQRHFTQPAAFSKLPLTKINRDSTCKPSNLTLSEWLILFKATRR